MSDIENRLIAQIRKGDKEAFNALFLKYFSALFLFAKGILNNATDAEDVVSDFFTSIWQNRKKLVISGSVKSYLYTSVRFQCYKLIRHTKVVFEYLKFKDQTRTDKDISYNDPVSRIESQELKDKINDAINSLSPQIKTVFLLSRYDHFKYHEIADRLGISINTVKKHMTSAISQLREELKEYL